MSRGTEHGAPAGGGSRARLAADRRAGGPRPSASSSSARTGSSVGPWDVSRLSGASADHVGLLVLDGVLSRELVVADHVSAELLGPGDLVRPWQASERRRAAARAGRLVGALDRHAGRARPPLRRRGGALPGDHRRALRPPGRALAAAGHHAGDLAAHPRRPPPEGAVLAPRRALGPRLRRRRGRAAGAHAPDPRPARRRPPPDRLDRAQRARRARGARAPAGRLVAAARRPAGRADARAPADGGRAARPGHAAPVAPLRPRGRGRRTRTR